MFFVMITHGYFDALTDGKILPILFKVLSKLSKLLEFENSTPIQNAINKKASNKCWLIVGAPVLIHRGNLGPLRRWRDALTSQRHHLLKSSKNLLAPRFLICFSSVMASFFVSNTFSKTKIQSSAFAVNPL